MIEKKITMMTLKHILSGMGVLSLMFLFSCSNDPIADGRQTSSTELTLSLSAHGLGTETITRVVVDATQEEQVVETLHLFFFESTSDQSGMLVDMIKLDQPVLPGNTAIPTASSPVSASGAYNVIGVANASLYNFDAEAWSGKSEKQFRSNALATLQASSTIESAGILMNATAAKAANEGSIDMKLTRNAARFDVVNNANGYTLVSASLRNVYNCSSITGDMTLDYSKDNTTARGAVSSEASATDNKINGQLYAFENLSTVPALGDKVTTCYIVELEKTGESGGKFHRINVHPNEAAQNIKRNKAYIATITGVISDGYDTADEAYMSKTDHLNYTINNWDLGDNGLIVSDSYSILAAPVKTIQFGTLGDTKKYTITTFSTLSNPSPLAVKNVDMPAGVTCTLVDNILTVTASALGVEDDRLGSITLTYAGLEATVNILQSNTVEAFLELSYGEGWTGLLSPMPDQKTKSVSVNASGEWSAEIIGDDGFVFDLNGTAQITSADATGNSFIIRTLSANPSKTETRKAFVIVSLNDDPVNYVGVVSVTQSASGAISISPIISEVIFDGGGNIITPAGITTFTVESATGTITSDRITIEGSHSERFDTELIGNQLRVIAKGKNSSSGNYSATLIVADDQNASIRINLIQRPLSLKIVTTSPTTVDAAAGETGLFYLSIDDAAAECKVTCTVKGVTKEVFNHEVLMLDESNNPINGNDYFPVAKKFKLSFPKIYFPNRETDIRVTVTFTTRDGATASYNFTQNKLASKGVTIWNARPGNYGSLNNGYFNGYGGAIGPYSASYNENNTTYVHVGTAAASYNWTTVEAFRSQKDAITMIVADGVGGTNNSTSPLKACGYTVVDCIGSIGYSTVKLHGSIESTRIGMFLTTKGKTPIASINIPAFYRDGGSTQLSAYPGSATVVLVAPNLDPVMVVDPLNRLVFLGEGQTFQNFGGAVGNSSADSRNRTIFMNNFIEYVHNAAKYGSHFTDMLIDGPTVPEPWDAVWGTNAWPN